MPTMAAVLVNSDESSDIQSLIGLSKLPVFALENDSVTYPFTYLRDLSWGTPEGAQRLCALAPTDSEVLRLLRQYKDNAHVLFPAIIHMEQFEAQVTQFLTNASGANRHHYTQRPDRT